MNVGVSECNLDAGIILGATDCPEDYCYDWDLGDGTIIIGGPAAIAHTYAASGAYIVCVTVYCCDEPNGPSFTLCEDIVVECCPEPGNLDIIVASSDDCNYGFCVVGDFDVTQHCVVWDWGDGVIENHPIDFCPLHQYTCDGTYTVCATVYCCNDDSIAATVCIDIVVDCPCNLPEFGDLVIGVDECNIDAGVILATTECPEDYCYTWDLGDGTVIVGGPGAIAHTYAASGTYTVCVSIYCCDEPNGPQLVICDEVTVDCGCKLPSSADISYDIVDCDIYVGAVYTDDYEGNLCFMWDFGDGSAPVPGETAMHSYAASGTYVVCLTIFCCDNPNETMAVCIEVTVNCCPQECQVFPRFTWDRAPLGNGDGCCANFYDISAVGSSTTITSYFWDFGDGNTSSLANPSHCFSDSGAHYVCLTITGVTPDGQECTQTFCWTITCCPSDITADGFVGTTDLLKLLSDFFSFCP